jgi:hypothetical protein
LAFAFEAPRVSVPITTARSPPASHASQRGTRRGVGEGGGLVGDRVRLGREDGLAHGTRVEQVELDRLRPERAYGVCLAGRAVGADHLVPSVDELGYEPAPDGAAGAGDENSHGFLLSQIVAVGGLLL